MHDNTFLKNFSVSSCDFCVWHPENIGWFMCISLSRLTTGVRIISRECVCAYIGISTVCGGDKCLSKHSFLWLAKYLLVFVPDECEFALTKICMLSIFPIDLSIVQALIYLQHTLIRLAQVCGSERRGLGFGFYLLRLANCDFQWFGVCEECCWLYVHKSDCLQTSNLLSEHPASDLFNVSSFFCRVLSVKITPQVITKVIILM